MRKVALASLIGTTVEWYDFFLFGTMAGLVFNKVFFPSEDPYIGLLLSYSSFATAYLSRPFGALIFGHFGDKIGRKNMLVITLMIMGVATVCIGLIPSYASIGIAAPILLQVLRLLQGLGLGGEWGGAILLAYEHSDKKKRAFYTSFPQMGQALALALSSAVVVGLSYFLTDEEFMTWGWRAAFISSFVLVFVALYIRLNIMETPAFEEARRKNAAKAEVKKMLPVVQIFKEYPRNILLGVGCRWIEGVSYNVLAVFSITYMTQIVGISRTDTLIPLMWAGIVMCPFILFYGKLADKLGAGKVFGFASLACGLSVFPAFWLIGNSGGNPLLLWGAVIVPLGICYAGLYSTMGTLFSGLFKVEVRYTGISAITQFPGFLVSGIVPLICVWLLKLNDGSPVLVCAYVLLVSLVGAIAAFAIQRGKFGEKGE